MKVDLIVNDVSPMFLHNVGNSSEDIHLIKKKMQVSFVRYDIVKTTRVRYLSKFAASFGPTKQWASAFPSYVDRSEDIDGGLSRIAITYEKSERGRYFPTTEDSFGLSMQRLPRVVRNALAPDNSMDIDVVNCAPSVLLSVYKKHGIMCFYLDYFCQNYDAFMEELSTGHDIKDVKAVKGWMLFGSGKCGWDVPAWVKSVNGERDLAVHELKKHYADLYEAAIEKDEVNRLEHRSKTKKAKKQGGEDTAFVSNVNGLFMDYLYLKLEGEMLVEIDKFGQDRGMWNDRVAWIHDGIMVFEPRGIDLQAIEQHLEESLGLRVRLERKSMEEKMEINVKTLPSEIMITNDQSHLEAAKIVLMTLDGVYAREGGTHYFLKRGLWMKDKVKESLFCKVADLNFKMVKKNKDGEDVEYPLSANYREAACVVNAAVSLLDKVHESLNFTKDIIMNGINKIKFQDGYYEFMGEKQDNGMYGRFVKDGILDSFTMVQNKFPPRIQEDINFVMEKIIDPIFDNTEDGLKPLFLKAISRAIAGSCDKITYIIHGPRNSGKSVLFQFLSNAFPQYCSTIPSTVFAVSSHALSGDSYRGNGFMVEAEHARIIKMSEMPPDGRNMKTKIDGSKLKVFQSMKEGIMARGLHQMQRAYYSLGTGFFLMNDVPEFVPLDSMDKCHLFEFPNEFVPEHEKKMFPYSSRKKLAVRDIELWILEEKYKNAFTHIVLEAYEPSDVIPLESMLQSKEDASTGQGNAAYLDVIEVTMDPEDKVEFTEIKKILEKIGCHDNPIAMGRNIRQMIEEMFHRYEKDVPDLKLIKFQDRRRKSTTYLKQYYRYIRLKSGGDNYIRTSNTEGGWDNERGSYASGFNP